MNQPSESTGTAAAQAGGDDPPSSSSTASSSSRRITTATVNGANGSGTTFLSATFVAAGGVLLVSLLPIAAVQEWQGLLWLLTLVCVLGAFLFTLLDEALQHVSQSKLMEATGEGKRSELLRMIEKAPQHRLLARIGQMVMLLGMLLGITGLFLGPATFAHAPAGEWASAIAYADLLLAVAIVVAIHLVFNKILAGYLGMAKAEPVVEKLLPLLNLMRVPLYPLLWAVKAGRLQATRLFGAPTPASADIERELIHLAEQAKGSGLLDRDEMAMLQKLIEFKDAVVEEVMTPRTEMFAVEVDTSLPEAIRIAHESGYTRLPVYEKNHDHVIGIFNTRDLLPHFSRIAEQSSDETVLRPEPLPSLREMMHEPYFVPEGKDVGDLLNEMTRNKISMAIVIDEYSGTAGIVTIEDIIEEIVGEIVDEYDFFEASVEERIVEVGPDVFEIDARMPVDDLNDKLKLELPEEEDFETLGGFLFFAFGSIPRAGDVIETHGARFEIIESEARRIKRVRVTLLEPRELDSSDGIAADGAAVVEAPSVNGHHSDKKSSRRLTAAGEGSSDSHAN